MEEGVKPGIPLKRGRLFRANGDGLQRIDPFLTRQPLFISSFLSARHHVLAARHSGDHKLCCPDSSNEADYSGQSLACSIATRMSRLQRPPKTMQMVRVK